MSRFFEEARERSRDEAIARAVGLSLDDYYESNADVVEDCSDDGLVYDYRVRFSEGTSERILAKVKGLDENRLSVSFGPSAPWDDQDEEEGD